ncbi:MAG: fused MFS/spermidine synthase [Prosthecobacter sp.]
MNSLPVRVIVAFLFFLSGLAALIYQVAWQRLLVVFAGGDVYSITLIVTAFMTGLGAGSLTGGVLADRSTPLRNLMLFGAAESLIAIFGLASKALYYDLLYLQFGGVVDSRVLTALVLLLSLLIPTFLMGVSLPLLARAMIHDLPEAAVKTGWLYGVNTLGAAMGALAATWMLMPQHGIEGSIYRAAMLNALCALVVVPLVLCRHKPVPMNTAPEPSAVPPSILEAPWNLKRCLLIYALSGFIALALEMVWFRLLGGMLKSTAFTFGTLLALYLTGVGAGSLAGTKLAARCHRPGAVFLWLQTSTVLYAGLITAAMLAAVHHWSPLREVRRYFDSYEPVDANTALLLIQKWWDGTALPEELAVVWIFPTLHFGLPLLMIGPPTFLMGLSFPLLQKVAHSDLASVGRRIGWIQSANIAGSMMGAVTVSTCLLPLLGTAVTLSCLVVLSAVFGWLAVRSMGMRPAFHAVWITLILATVVFIPDQRTLWARAHGTTPERIHLAEDGAGVSLLKKPAPDESPGAPTVVFVNGIGQSWIPFGGVHSLLGALPTLLHPRPEEIAIIGLGSADTLFSALARYETREVVCIEIVGAQFDTLRAHAAGTDYAALGHALDDPRVRHVKGDGRLHLMTTGQRFDIIEADALRPTSAHSGTLYSEEYFSLLSQRLKPGGYAVTWSPTQRVHDTFVKVFPHVLSVGPILIGSNESIEIDAASLQSRLGYLEVRQHFRSAGIDIRALLAPILDAGVTAFGPEYDRSRLIDTNTDVFPKDELSLPALWGQAQAEGR